MKWELKSISSLNPQHLVPLDPEYNSLSLSLSLSLCVCVRACASGRARACVCVCFHMTINIITNQNYWYKDRINIQNHYWTDMPTPPLAYTPPLLFRGLWSLLLPNNHPDRAWREFLRVSLYLSHLALNKVWHVWVRESSFYVLILEHLVLLTDTNGSGLW